MRFYLTNSSHIDNIIDILKTGVIKPGGGNGMISHDDENSKYLYFELVFPELKRSAPGFAIYYDYSLLKDYDFYYIEGWSFIDSDKDMGTKFPKKNIYKKLKSLELKYLKRRNKRLLATGESPVYGYQFVTKSSIPIEKKNISDLYLIQVIYIRI